MKPPWLTPSQESAELEALQTDVMRFIAILGLCLAAIFSLVHSAALEQASARTSSVPPDTQPTPLDEPQLEESRATPTREKWAHVSPRRGRAAPGVAPESPPAPASVPKKSRTGFTLEFASADILQMLVRQGAVSLYARLGPEFWIADRQGRFMSTTAPVHYYQMQPETVPAVLRSALRAVAGTDKPDWGVTLPGTTIEQISQLTSAREGGQLVISENGNVSLE